MASGRIEDKMSGSNSGKRGSVVDEHIKRVRMRKRAKWVCRVGGLACGLALVVALPVWLSSAYGWSTNASPTMLVNGTSSEITGGGSGAEDASLNAAVLSTASDEYSSGSSLFDEKKFTVTYHINLETEGTTPTVYGYPGGIEANNSEALLPKDSVSGLGVDYGLGSASGLTYTETYSFAGDDTRVVIDDEENVSVIAPDVPFAVRGYHEGTDGRSWLVVNTLTDGRQHVDGQVAVGGEASMFSIAEHEETVSSAREEYAEEYEQWSSEDEPDPDAMPEWKDYAPLQDSDVTFDLYVLWITYKNYTVNYCSSLTTAENPILVTDGLEWADSVLALNSSGVTPFNQFDSSSNVVVDLSALKWYADTGVEYELGSTPAYYVLTDVKSNDESDPADDPTSVNVYPHWNIAFNANNGVNEDEFTEHGALKSRTGTLGLEYFMEYTAPDKGDFANGTSEFLGWSSDPNATEDSGDIIEVGATITATENNMTYYAIWEGAGPVINTLTLDYNGGTKTVDGESVTSEVVANSDDFASGTYQLPVTADAAGVTAPAGKMLVGWELNGSLLKDGDLPANSYTYDISEASVTLTAVWDDAVEVKYQVASASPSPAGTVSLASQTIGAETGIKVSGGAFVEAEDVTVTPKPGYSADITAAIWSSTVDGWAQGTSSATLAVSDLAKDGDKYVAGTYTATLTEDTATYTYAPNNANYGTVSPSSETPAVYNGTVSGATATNETGYHFIKWTDGNGTQVGTSASYAPSKTTAAGDWLADHWVGGTYTAVFGFNVTFDGNGADSFTPENFKLADQTAKLSTVTMPMATDCTRSGYTLVGFTSTAADKDNPSAESIVAPGKNATDVEGDTTFYAVWDQNVTISYEASPSGYGSVRPASESIGQVTGSVSGSTLTYTAADYDFLGWSQGSATMEPTLGNNASITPTREDGTNWTAQTYYANLAFHVTFDGNGVDASSNNLTKQQATASVTLPTVSRSGYNLVGWTTTEADKDDPTADSIVAAGTAVNVSKNTTFYAVWDEQVTLNYTVSGGHGNVSASSEVVGSKAGTPSGVTLSPDDNYTLDTITATNSAPTTTVSGSTFVPDRPTGGYVDGTTYTITYKLDTSNIKFNAVYHPMGGTWTAGGSGTGDYTVSNIAYGNKSVTLPTAIEREDYTFAGWTQANTGAVTDTLVASPFDLATATGCSEEGGTANFYAVWDANATISYASSDSSIGTAYKTGTTDSSETLGSVLSTPAGATATLVKDATKYEFTGWTFSPTTGTSDWSQGTTSTTLSAGDLARDGSSALVSGTYTANFREKTATLTLDLNGGTYDGSTDDATIIVGFDAGTTVPDGNSVTRNGYVLAGWSSTTDDPEATTTTVLDDVSGTYHITANTTLHAIWDTEVTLNYVSANTARGTVSASTETVGATPVVNASYSYLNKPAGSTAAVNNAYFTFAGWTFDGDNTWSLNSAALTSNNLARDASGKYASGTYTAAFSDTDVTYTFASSNTDYGTVSPAEAVTVGMHSATDAQVTATATANADYKLIKWVLSGTSVSLGTGGEFIPPKNNDGFWPGGNYVAVFGFDATFDEREGSTVTDATDLTSTQNVTMPSSKKSGFVLAGWSTDSGRTAATFDPSTNTETDFAVDASVEVSKNTTFYAIWDTAVELTYVSSNASFGSVSPATNTVGSKTTAQADGSTATANSDYDFLGWSVGSVKTSGFDYEGTKYQPMKGADDWAATTYYANFAYHVTLDYNGGTADGSDATQDATTYKILTDGEGTSITLPSTGITNGDNMLLGWSTNKNATANDTLLTGTTTATKNTTYYAIWDTKSTVTYRTNNVAYGKIKIGDGELKESDSETVAVSQTSSTLAGATAEVTDNTLYKFVGWTANNAGTSGFVSTSASYTPPKSSSNVTYYANFVPITYTVKYTPGANATESAKAGFAARTSTVNAGDAPTAFNGSTATAGSLQVPKGAAGYYFTGWTWAEGNPAVSKTWSVTSGGATSGEALPTRVFQDYEFVASWAPKTGYEVAYNLNGGKYNDTDTLGNYTQRTWESDVLSESAQKDDLLTREGYAFAGWYTAQAGGTKVSTTTQYKDLAGTDDVNPSKTLYAHWTAGEADIVFMQNANVDDATKYTQASTTDATTTLDAFSGMGLSKTGYHFTGWASDASGATPTYTDRQSNVDVGQGKTLYAQWEANDYTIVFDTGIGGSVKTAFTDGTDTAIAEGATQYSQKMTYDAAATALMANHFEYAGHSLKGWKVAGSANEYDYEPGQAVSNLAASGTITLTAVWGNNVDLIYVANNATDATALPETDTRASGSEFTVAANSMTRTGYTPSGWNTKADGSGTHYGAGDKLTLDSTRVLYAEWTAKNDTPYKVRYFLENPNTGDYDLDTNVGTDGVVSKTGTTDATITLAMATEGYTLPSPASNYSINTSKTNLSGKTVSATSEVTVDVYYALKSIEVTYQWSGAAPSAATIGTTTVSTKPGATVTVPANDSYRADAVVGWTFSGWTASDSTVVAYNGGTGAATFTAPNDDITVSGTWERNKYSVTFVADNRSGAVAEFTNPSAGALTNQTSVDFESAIDVTDVAVQLKSGVDNYVNTSWSYEVKRGAETVKSGTVEKLADLAAEGVTVEGDVTITANWDPTYALKYVVAGEETSSSDDEYPGQASGKAISELPYRDANNGNANEPTGKAGYTFDGWTYNGSKSLPETLDDNYTFVATWKKASYALTFDLDDGALVGSYTLPGPTEEVGDVVSLPTADDVSKAGYELTGWVVTESAAPTALPVGAEYAAGAIDFKMPAGAVTLKAQYSQKLVNYYFEMDGNGVSLTNDSDEGLLAATGTAKTSKPTAAAGYELDKWVRVTQGESGEVVSDIGEYATVASDGTLTPAKVDGAYPGGTFRATFKARTATVTFTAGEPVRGSIAGAFINGGTVAYGAQFTGTVPTVANNGIVVNDGYALAAADTWTYEMYPYTEGGGTSDEAVEDTVDNPANLTITGPVIFYAHFDANKAYVEFDGNGATSGAYDAREGVTGGTVTLPGVASFERAGYTCDGWSTTETGEKEYEPTATFPAGSEGLAAGTTKLYAHWVPNPHTITYDVATSGAQTGTGAPASTAFTYSDAATPLNTVSLSSDVPTNSDPSLEFKEWNTNPTGDGTSYAPGDVYPKSGSLPDEDVTLYAIYQTKTIHVTYDGGIGGIGTMLEQTTLYGGTVTLRANTFTCPNKLFSVWLGSDGKTYTDGETTSALTEDLTLTALWKADPNAVIYTVRYMKQTGTNEDGDPVWEVQETKAAAQVTTGFDAVEPASVPDRKRFVGWTTSESAIGGNDSEIVTSERQYKDLSSNAVTEGSVDLYPHFYLNEYEIVYLPSIPVGYEAYFNGATMENQSVVFGATSDSNTLTLRDNAYDIGGLKFKGWNKSASAIDGTVQYSDGQSLTADVAEAEDDPEAELYAVWTLRDDYKVHFLLTDDGESASDFATVDSYKWLDAIATPGAGTPTAHPTDATVEFAGWYTQSNGGGTQVTLGTTQFGQAAGSHDALLAEGGTPTTLNLYANWISKANAYRVTFNVNGGTGTLPVSYISGLDGDGAGLIANNLTKAGYHANGWGTSTSGGTLYGDGYAWVFGQTSTDKNVELFAQFAPNSYNIRYDGNGGSLSDADAKSVVSWGGTGLVANAPTATRDGYTFAGWYTAAAGGALVNADSTYSAAGLNGATSIVDAEGGELSIAQLDTNGATVTLYAHWTENSNYTVAFDLDSGTYGDSSTVSALNSVKWTDYGLLTKGGVADASKLARDGYTIDSANPWVDSAGNPVDDNTIYNTLPGAVDGSVTLKANWVENEATITYMVDHRLHGVLKASTGTEGTKMSDKVKVDTGTADALPSYTVVPTEGYVFTGWYVQGAPDTKLETDADAAFKAVAPNGLWTDVTYVAGFKESDETRYYVDHYLQAIDGTYASEPTESIVKLGTTGELVDAEQNGLVGDYEGFTYNRSITGTVAADRVAGDSSTHLKLYYERGLFNVTYAWGSDKPTPTPALPTGASLQAPGTTQTSAAALTVDGYAFKGWSPSVAVTSTDESVTYDDGNLLPANTQFLMPGASVVLTPVLEKDAYTVTFEDPGDRSGTVTDNRADGDAKVALGGTVSASDYTVAPAAGYRLVAWKVTVGSAEPVTTSTAPENWPITADTTFEPVFAQDASVVYTVGEHGAFDNATGVTLFAPATGNMANYLFGGSMTSSDTNYGSYFDTTGANAGKPKAEAGWTFVGWSWVAVDAGGELIESSDNLGATDAVKGGLPESVPTGSITFTALWEGLAQTIMLSAGDGAAWSDGTTGDKTVSAYKTGDTFTVPADGADDAPVKDNYTLYGWKDSDGNFYSADGNDGAGASFIVPNGGVTLTPVWVATPATVTYSVNDPDMGTVSRASESLVSYGSAIKGSAATAKPGYRFTGWTDASTGAAPEAAVATLSRSTVDNDTITPKEPVVSKTFVANFEPIPYSVTFTSDANGSITADTRDPKTVDYNTALGAVEFAKVEYAPNPGYAAEPTWNVTMDNAATGETDVEAEDVDPATLTITGNAVFKAVWTAKSDYKVVYVTNSDDTADRTTEGVSWTTANLAAKATFEPVKKGAEFLGWYLDEGLTSAAGESATFGALAGNVEPDDATVMLFAKYQDKEYSVKYNATGNGNVIASHSGYAVSDNVLSKVKWGQSDFNAAVFTPTRTGYDFKGWYTGADGTGSKVVDGATTYASLVGGVNDTIMQADVFGYWTETRYTVNYDLGYSGAPAIEPTSATWFSPVTLTADPERDGYVFKGWWYENSGGANVQAESGTTMYSDLSKGDSTVGSVTLTAKWVPLVNYTIELHPWRHSDVGDGFNYESAEPAEYWRDDNVLTLSGDDCRVEDGTVLLEADVVKSLVGFEKFDYTYSDAFSYLPAQKLSGKVEQGGQNKFVVYYKEKKDYKVVYDLNLGSDEASQRQRPADENGNLIAAPESAVDQWWSDAGYYTAIDELIGADDRPGYTFTGWNTDPDGEGIDAEDDNQMFYQLAGNEQIVSLDNVDKETVTLYAQWTEKPVPIVYMTADSELGEVQLVRGGSADEEVDETIGMVHGSANMGAIAVPARGYHLDKWIVNYKFSDDAEAVDYELPASMSGASVDTQAMLLSAQAVGDVVMTTQADGQFYVYSTDTQIEPSMDPGTYLYPQATYVALYAQNAEASITYAGNGGTGSVAPATAVIEFDVTVAANGFTREGYVFTGWNTAADGSGTSYEPGDVVEMPEGGLALYAQWARATVKVTIPTGFDANGNPTGSKVVEVLYGDPIPTDEVSIAAPAGKHVDHYVVKFADGTSKDFTSFSDVVLTQDATLSVVFADNADGSSSSTKPTYVRPAKRDAAAKTGDNLAIAPLLGVAALAACIAIAAAFARRREHK